MPENCFAGLSIKLDQSADESAVKQIQNMLLKAAKWANADDPKTFFDEKDNVVGITVGIVKAENSMLETGRILGQCEAEYENSNLDLLAQESWLSILRLQDN